MSDPLEYEVVVVGGGPAGLTTALYTTRLGHRTAVFEKEGGRHELVSHVHNLIGISEDVSGAELAEHGARQLEEYGGDLLPDAVTDVSRVGEGADGDDWPDQEGGSDGRSESDGSGEGDGNDGSDGDGPRFRIEATRSTVLADRVVFATGFTDLPPDVAGLRRFTGRGLHYCLHCDAYSLGDGRAYVLGHDEDAAEVAMMLCNVTADVDLLLDAEEPTWDEETERQLAAHPVDRVDAHVVSAFPKGGAERSRDGEDGDEPWLGGFEFGDGTEREYVGGFAMYGREYNAELPSALGCDLGEDGAVAVDERRETSVDGAYAVGDVTHGQNQTTIAVGDAAYAGIAIHKDLRRFPLPPDEVAEGDPGATAPAAPADLRARMRRVRERDVHAGLREPRPDG